MKTVKIIFFLMLLATICTTFLASGNYAYFKLSSVFNVRLYGTILNMFEIDHNENNIETIFHEKFDTKTIGNTNYYLCRGEPSPGTVVFKHDGPGLWSNIEILLAVKKK